MIYTELISTIQSSTQNYEPDFVARIPLFIRQAETRIYNNVQLPAQRQNVAGQVTANNPYLTLPSNWLSAYSVAVIDPVTGEYTYLLDKDVNFIREAFPYPAVTGKPSHYAVFDQNTFLMGPTPDTNYAVEMHYNAYPPSITVAGSSWLGTNFPTVLLYGALLEAYTFMKGEADVMAMYQKRYDDAMVELKRLGDGLDRQDAYRSGQARIKVN